MLELLTMLLLAVLIPFAAYAISGAMILLIVHLVGLFPVKNEPAFCNSDPKCDPRFVWVSDRVGRIGRFEFCYRHDGSYYTRSQN